MAKFSIMLPFAPVRPEHAIPMAALTQWSTAHRLWQGQAVFGDAHQTFAVLAASGFRVPVGTGVALMPYRHPYDAALQMQSVAAVTGHPAVAGYGPGARSLQRSMLGSAYPSPLNACREYLTLLRALLDGETVAHSGEYYTCHNKLAAVPVPHVEVGLGVLRPSMSRLAGAVADVAITWMTPAGYLAEEVVPAVHKGAAEAGRKAPRVVAIVPVALIEKERDREELALESNAGHMRLPHYVDMLRRSGIGVDMDADPTASARALIEGGAFLSGDIASITQQLEEFGQAGVDEVVLNVTGVCGRYGNQAALAELDTILKEVAS